MGKKDSKGNTEVAKATEKSERVEQLLDDVEGVDAGLVNDTGDVSLEESLKELKAAAMDEGSDNMGNVSESNDEVTGNENSDNAQEQGDDSGNEIDERKFNKLKELERKNKEIYDDKKRLEDRLARLEETIEKGTMGQDKFSGVEKYSDEWYEKVGEKYGLPPEYVKGTIRMNEDALRTMPLLNDIAEIRKELSDIKTSEFKKTEKGKLESNKLYSILKDDIEELLESDEIKALPENRRYRIAYLEAKERNESKIAEAIKRTASDSKGGKRIIPSIGSNSGSRIIPKSTLKLTSDDIRIAKKLGHRTTKDIEELDNVPETWVEGNIR